MSFVLLCTQTSSVEVCTKVLDTGMRIGIRSLCQSWPLKQRKTRKVVSDMEGKQEGKRTSVVNYELRSVILKVEIEIHRIPRLSMNFAMAYFLD